MPRRIGPFDNRFKRKRCLACVEAHAKCDGQLPCSQCLFTGRTCMPTPVNSYQISIKFVSEQKRDSSLGLSTIPASPSSTWTDRCIAHLLNSFLYRHNFTGNSRATSDAVKELLCSSECLQNAILAVSSLDLKKRRICAAQKEGKHALEYYQDAVVALRAQVEDLSSTCEANNALLWTTLFLSIFELMYETSGSGFLLHFTQGTAKLLQRRDLCYYLQNGGDQILRMSRIFEMTRAMVFWSDSFLDEEEWEAMVYLISENNCNGHDVDEAELAFESISKIIGQVRRLTVAVSGIIDSTNSEAISVEKVHELEKLAERGLQLHQALEIWCYDVLKPHINSSYIDAVERFTNLTETVSSYSDLLLNSLTCSQHPWPTRLRINPQLVLSQIYYHTIAMNLAHVFDKHPHFSLRGIITPMMSSLTVQSHVMTMLNLMEYALEHTSIAAVLLVWPLRAAGVRAVNVTQVSRVKAMLEEIASRGFVIATSFQEMCTRVCWEPRGLA